MLGWAGIREINESDGRLRGRGLAVAGMVFGAVVTLLCVEWVAWALIGSVRQQGKRADAISALERARTAAPVALEPTDTFVSGG